MDHPAGLQMSHLFHPLNSLCGDVLCLCVVKFLARRERSAASGVAQNGAPRSILRCPFSGACFSNRALFCLSSLVFDLFLREGGIPPAV